MLEPKLSVRNADSWQSLSAYLHMQSWSFIRMAKGSMFYYNDAAGDSLGRTLHDWLLESCEVCKSPAQEEKLLICSNDTCQKLYHTFCLRPALKALPSDDEDWFCQECLRQK